jgi:hypothetical protein
MCLIPVSAFFGPEDGGDIFLQPTYLPNSMGLSTTREVIIILVNNLLLQNSPHFENISTVAALELRW